MYWRYLFAEEILGIKFEYFLSENTDRRLLVCRCYNNDRRPDKVGAYILRQWCWERNDSELYFTIREDIKNYLRNHKYELDISAYL